MRRSTINVKMSPRELMRNFFDALKSATAGYGSLNYKIAEMREAVKGSVWSSWISGWRKKSCRRFPESSAGKSQKDAEAVEK